MITPPSPPLHVSAASGCPTYPLAIDRASFEKEYCASVSERAGSGVALLRGVMGADELLDLRSLFDRIPYPNRYLCGHSDDTFWTPSECLFDAGMLLRRFPTPEVSDIVEQTDRLACARPRGKTS